MLIDSLTYALEQSEALQVFWGKLDDGDDATLGVASSARPFMVAARFAHKPQPTLVVVAGEEAAATTAVAVEETPTVNNMDNLFRKVNLGAGFGLVALEAIVLIRWLLKKKKAGKKATA